MTTTLGQYSAEEKALVKKTIFPEATLEELQLFFHDCRRRGIHPLDRKIHPTRRKNKDGTYRYVPIVSIDFLREQAAGTGQCLGISDPVFTGVALGKDFKATVMVKRAVGAHVAEFQATARWEEYCPLPGKDHMWKKMPHVMLGKVAEALALRKAFPGDETGGLYTQEELDQAPPENPMTKAMMQDFPPGQELQGVLLEIEKAQGQQPASVKIQGDDGVMTYQVFGDEGRFSDYIGRVVTYIYRKNGKFRVVVDMYTVMTDEPVPVPPSPPPAHDYLHGVIDKVETKTYRSGKNKGQEYGAFTIAGVSYTSGFGLSPEMCGVEQYDQLLGCAVYFLHTTSEDGKWRNITELIPADVFEQALAEKG